MRHQTPLIDHTNASYFFDHVCPAILSAFSRSSKGLGGRVAIRVSGERGGDWLIDLGTAQVQRQIQGEYDVFLEMEAAEFGALLRGTLDISDAVLEGRVRYSGDLLALVRLGAILEQVEG